MGWTYSNVDWSATEACGTWAGAIMTAGAVFMAAQISQWRESRRQILEKKEVFATLGRLFNEACNLINGLRDAASLGKKGVGPSPPEIEDFDDLIEVLRSIDVFRLRSFLATQRLFEVKRYVMMAKEKRRQYDTAFQMFVDTSDECDLWFARTSNAAFEAELAEKAVIWPHKNRAGEWSYSEI